MKLLHTADWHIGQLFFEYDRTWEHERFLDWLVNTLQTETIDVLLLSGDVFDLSNPSAASVKLFYSFLNRAIRAVPHLQIIVTAGNHDSAHRLESPKPLLESSNIQIVGVIERSEDGSIDFGKLTVPIKDRDGIIKAWCLAVPYLRMGDYPVIAGSDNPYATGVARLYEEAYAYVCGIRDPGQAVLALGHLHTQQAETGDMDRPERLIMGGVECIPVSAFHPDIRYVALGHIHRAQRIGGHEHIRYSGSPLPMSFSETHYQHQVVVFDLEGEQVVNIRPLEVPVSVPLIRIPATHTRLPEVITALGQLPEMDGGNEPLPYLEVRVLADGPEPILRHRVNEALAGKAVRLAKIDVRYASSAAGGDEVGPAVPDELAELNPAEVFSRVYRTKFGAAAPEELVQLFNEIAAGLADSE